MTFLKYPLVIIFIFLSGCSLQDKKTAQNTESENASSATEKPQEKLPEKIKPSAPVVPKSIIERKKHYDENGQLAYIITYKDNIKMNQETFTYYQTGELSIRATFVDELKTGLVKHYSKNGDIWRTEQYRKGKKEGFSISYYSPNLVAKKLHFSNGLTDGVQQDFLRDGKRSDKWIYKQGKLISHFKFQYFENGNLQQQSSYRDGKKNGISKTYSEQGFLATSVNYKDDLHHGKMIEFYNNGLIKSEKRYQDNLQHGSSSGYFLTGELQWQSNYHQGVREGIYKEYYQNGQLKKQISYHNNQQNGAKRFFHENGFLKYELTMKNSKANGLLKEFDDKGHLKLTQHYTNGKVTEKNGDFLNGYLGWLSDNKVDKLLN